MFEKKNWNDITSTQCLNKSIHDNKKIYNLLMIWKYEKNIIKYFFIMNRYILNKISDMFVKP